MTDRQVGETKLQRVLQGLLADFRKAGTPSKVAVIALLALAIWTAYQKFDGYEFYVNEDASGYWINDRYVHIHLYSWWGLRDKFYDVQKRPVPGQDYSAWYVREKDAKDSEWRQLFQLGQYDETLLTIGFQ